MSYLSRLLLIVLLAGFLGGCGKKSNENYIAKVGDSGLTKDAAARLVPDAYQDQVSPAQMSQLVTQWVRDELLYQEALRQNLQKDPELEARIAQVRRKMIIERLLDKTVESQVKVSDTMVSGFFDEHRLEFQRQRDEWRVIRFVADVALPLDDIKRRLTAGDQVRDIYLGGMDPNSGLRQDMGYVPPTQFSAAARKLMDKAKLGQPVGPLVEEQGYTLYVITDRAYKGSTRKLEEVADAIRSQLETTLRDSLTEAMLKQCKSHNSMVVDPKYLLGAGNP